MHAIKEKFNLFARIIWSICISALSMSTFITCVCISKSCIKSPCKKRM